jgi:hypothetical protein
MLLKLRCDGPLSNAAFNFNLCRYTKALAKKAKARKGGGSDDESEAGPYTRSHFRST